jgi:hypothetical protein
MSEPTQIKVTCSGPQQLERRGLYSPRTPMSPTRAQWLQDRLDLLGDELRVSRAELAEAMRVWLEREGK